ncbi:MAG TPA: salt stress protein, Slr1339 family [Xenococcaceae cyanobacterium]
MGEMDDLLKELKAEFRAETKSQPQSSSKKVSPIAASQASSSPLDSLIADVKKEFESGKTPSAKSPDSLNRANTFANNSKSNLVKELQQEYQEQQKIERQQQQQEIQRRQEALKRQAQQWLNNLDLNTDEGLWFEEFSYSYDSKLAAAMDYLAALEK